MTPLTTMIFPACLSRAIPLFLLFAGMPAAPADTLFEDGFEHGHGAWTTATTGQGRVTLSTDHGPATGSHHLILDDSVNDSTYSVAEATVSLDLSLKRNVVLQFKAKSLGNEPHHPPGANFGEARTYDGVAVSTDGGTTWRTVASLARAETAWSSYSVTLDPVIGLLGGTFGPDFRIRFSTYDNAPVPLDGLAIDDVVVTADADQRVAVELGGPVREGSGPHTGTVRLHYAQDTPVSLMLLGDPNSMLALPPTVTVPAGANSATFQYHVRENDLVTLTLTSTVTAHAPGIASTAAKVAVLDNEAFTISVNLPESVTEGTHPTNNATVTITPPPAIPVALLLTADPFRKVDLTPSHYLKIAAGQSEAAFTIRAAQGSGMDGDSPVVISCAVQDTILATGMTTVLAADRELSLNISTSVTEGTTNHNSRVSIRAAVSHDVEVSLELTGGGGITLPTPITIPAGNTSVSLPITADENDLREGTQTATFRVSAEGFAPAFGSIQVQDNDRAGYRLTNAREVMNLGSPEYLSFAPIDLDGNVVPGVNGDLNVELILPDGSTLPASPPTTTVKNSSGSISVTLPVSTPAGSRLRLTDAAGYSATSPPFDGIRSLVMKTSDIVWDPGRQRIYASVMPADTSAYKNQVVAIDPVTLQIVGSVSAGQDPRKLCLSPTGKYLHVAIYGNVHGNGSVARIDLDSLSLAGSFPLATSNAGALYARNLAVAPGEQEAIIVTQGLKSSSWLFNTTVYAGGVPLPDTGSPTSSNLVPTEDPTVFIGYNSGYSTYPLTRLKIGATGATLLEAGSSPIGSFDNLQYGSGRYFADTGKILDASTLTAAGSFPVRGAMRAEPEKGRVYFLESGSPSWNGPYIVACDSDRMAVVRKKVLPSATLESVNYETLLRWGPNGFAWRTNLGVKIATTAGLVPEAAPANLKISVTTPEQPSPAGAAVTYTVRVTNEGPNPAPGTVVTATLSEGQTLVRVSSDTGSPQVTGTAVTLQAGSLASGSTVTLALEVTPQGQGTYCQASAASGATDPDGSDNFAIKFANAGYQSGPDGINTLRLGAKSMIYDRTRGLLWVAIGTAGPALLAESLVTVDPRTGEVSPPLPIRGTPNTNAIALSANGRYLYVGLSDQTELRRIDLEASPPAIVNIPAAPPQNGPSGHITDIEVLEGDGRSVLVGTSRFPSVIDDTTLRGDGSTNYSVNFFEPTDVPDVFIGGDIFGSGVDLGKYRMGPDGIERMEEDGGSFSGGLGTIGEGGLLLTSAANLIDSTDLTLKLSWSGVNGSPCLDTANGRAYIATPTALRAFDIGTGLRVASLPAPLSPSNFLPLRTLRWGADGMAVRGADDAIHILRWPVIAASIPQEDADEIDGSYFAALGADLDADPDGDGLPAALEYLFGTALDQPSANPLKVSFTGLAEGRTLVLEFPRRSDAADAYRIQIATDLADWQDAENVVERVTATRMVEGTSIDTVRAEIPMTGGRGFVRINANTP